MKLIQLEKSRDMAHHRETDHNRKLKAAEDKMALNLVFEFTPDDKNNAFKKLVAAAKKYDKTHPVS